jgi:hypothetical protein
MGARMSGIADHADAIQNAAMQAAIEAGALKTCAVHDYVTIRTEDPDAERLAFAIGTNIWKTRMLGPTRDELMDAIKDAIEQGADECPKCAEIRDDD